MKNKTQIMLFTTGAILLGLSGCSNQEESVVKQSYEFTEYEHERNEDYAALFQAQKLEMENMDCYFQQEIFEEEKDIELAEKIEQEEKEIEEKLEISQPPKLEIYVVTQTTTGLVQDYGQAIYVGEEDLESESFRQALIRAYTDTASIWKSAGLEKYIFESDESYFSNEKELTDYLAKEETSDIISLFPAYFIQDFSDEEQMKYATQIAAYVTKYAIEQYDTETFLKNENQIDFRNEWLKSVGSNMEVPYTEQQLEEVCDGKVSYSVEYAFTLLVDTWRINYKAVDWLPDAKDCFLFTVEMMDGYHTIAEELEKNQVGQEITEKIEAEKILQIASSTRNASQTKDMSIVLNSQSSILHEIVHILVPCNDIIKKMWADEGFAEAMSREILAENDYLERDWKDACYYYLTLDTQDDSSKLTDEMKEFQQKLREDYCKEKDFPQTEDEIDTILFYNCFAEGKALNHTMETGWDIADYALSEHVSKKTEEVAPSDNPNELSYVEAYSFVNYLIEQNGIAKVVKFIDTDQTFEEAFGIPYAEAYNNWITTIKTRSSL